MCSCYMNFGTLDIDFQIENIFDSFKHEVGS